MKHPTFKAIQDYFEGESSDKSQKLSEHFKSCDRCSTVLAQMAKVDILFSKQEMSRPSATIKNETFLKASELLKLKRNKREHKHDYSKRFKEITYNIHELLSETLITWRSPLIQVGSLCIIMIVFTKISTEKTYIKKYKLIQDEPQIIYSEYAGEKQ